MKILIVDDEMMIKEWLKHTISSLPFEIDLLETASNGLEALERIKETRFDLIFIDITMPRMNGIELLKKLNDQAVDSMLIVLSSHDEFQFAREAIKYHISEYVLKNECSKEKLTEILHSCHEKSQNNRKNSLTGEFMERVLKGTPPQTGVDLVRTAFPGISGKLFFISAGKMDTDKIPDKLQGSGFSLEHEGLVGRVEDLAFSLFSIKSRDESSSFNYNYSELLYKSLGTRVFCGKLCRNYEEILPECRSSWTGYQNLFYISENHSSQLCSFRDFDTNTVDSLCETAISDIRSYNKEKTVSDIHEMNSYFSTARPTDVESLINVYLSLVSTFIIFNNSKSRDITRKLDAIRQSVTGIDCFDELSAWIVSMFESNIDLVDRSRYSEAVEKSIEFIEQNYQSIVNVSEIADHVNLSPDYFSRLFRKEVGETLNSYLINFRLEKASIILISSNLSIQEVARKVGIENGSYFSKCFKKKFNTQPIQFRVQTKQSE